MARNPISSVQNENLRPLLYIIRGIVTIKSWSQNLILTTRIVKNGCLRVFGPKSASAPISDYSSGQNQILRPLLDSSYNHITIKKWSYIFISATRCSISSHIVLYGPKNGKKWQFMNLMKMVQIVKIMKLCYCGSGEVFQFKAAHQSINKNPVQSFLAHM